MNISYRVKEPHSGSHKTLVLNPNYDSYWLFCFLRAITTYTSQWLREHPLSIFTSLQPLLTLLRITRASASHTATCRSLFRPGATAGTFSPARLPRAHPISTRSKISPTPLNPLACASNLRAQCPVCRAPSLRCVEERVAGRQRDRDLSKILFSTDVE